MKMLYHVSLKLVLIAIACSFAVSTTTQASGTSSHSIPATSAENARLVVIRSADFGTQESIRLFIDGVEVTDIQYNESYETALRPGEHVLTIGTNLNAYGGPTELRFNVEAGKTYVFTAVWNDPERASLELSPEG